MTAPLPNEILVDIFQHLTLYSQRQCLQVCKSWSTVAHTFIDNENQRVEVSSDVCLRRLLQEVSSDSARGSSIRQLYFIMQRRAYGYDLPSLLSSLALACPNLAELVFVNIYSHSYINNLLCDAVKLPKLEAIRFGSPELYHRYAPDLVNLSIKHRRTINQLSIRLGVYDTYVYGGIANYIQQLENLKYLSLTTSCPIVFDALITACPQLQVLKLKMLNNAAFQVLEEDEANNTASQASTKCPVFQLETLKIDHGLLSRDLYDYLKRHCRYLSQLALCINPDEDLSPLVYTLTVFNQARALPITHMSIDGDLMVTNILTSCLYKWFPHVRQLEINCFDNETASNNTHYNFLVELQQMDLSYLSLDISDLFKSNKTPFARVALQVTTTHDGATLWYQREGKWKTDKHFLLKNSHQFTNFSTRQNRMLSDTTAVITIKTLNVQRVHVYFDIHKNSFSQVIHLK